MGKHSEAFVGFDVAKKRHAAAIAEGGRTGEVRFLREVENSPPPIERTIKRLATVTLARLHRASELTGVWAPVSPKTLGHSPKARLVVTRIEVRS